MSTFTELKLLHKARTIYVVLLKDDQNKLTLLVDPGLNRPWSSPNKKFADFQAKNCDGMAATVEDAWSLLMKENPLFEKQLIESLTTQVKKPNYTANDGTQITDANGRPLV